jgi:tetratricopeptide (TPR) repeat protein
MGWFSGKKKATLFVSKEVMERTDHDLLAVAKYFALGQERSETKIPSDAYFSYNNTVTPAEINELVVTLCAQTYTDAAIDIQIFSKEKSTYEGMMCNEHLTAKGKHTIFIPDHMADHPLHLTASIVQQLCEIKLEKIFSDRYVIRDAASVLSFCYGFGIFHLLSLRERERLRHFPLSFLSEETMLYCAAAAHDLGLNSTEKFRFYVSSDSAIRVADLTKGITEHAGRERFRKQWHEQNSRSWDYYIVAHGEAYEDETMDAVKRLIKLLPQDYTLIHYLAYGQLQRGMYMEAIKGFTDVISADPFFAYAFNNRGLAHLFTGSFGKALEDLKTSERLDPENSFNRRNFGIYWLMRGKADQAIKEFEKAQRMNYKTEHIHYWLGKAHYALGNHQEALRHFDLSRSVPELPAPVYPL